MAGRESAFNECLPSVWIREWPYDDTRIYQKTVISQETGQSWGLGSATNVSCYPRQLLKPIKSAEWEKHNDCFWLPYRYVMRINETVHVQRLQFLWRKGLMFFSWCAHCWKFQQGTGMVFSGGIGPREIKFVLLTRFYRRLYELPLSGCGAWWEFAITCRNCENLFFPLC